MSERGVFITLEGSEGVGKTTNLQLVRSLVEEAGHPCRVTREPGGTPLAEEIRTMLLDVRDEPVADMAELLLVFAARAQHVETVIEPALARGEWVLCDRFTDATYAYQGGGRGMDASAIATLEQLVQQGLQPDLTLYLDVAPATAAERISDREHDRFEREQRAFFDAVRNVYLARADALERYRLIDAGQPLEAVQHDIREVLGAFLERF